MDNITQLSSAEAIPKTSAVVGAMIKDPSLYALVESFFPKQEELKEVVEEHKAAFSAAADGDPEKLKQLKVVRQKLDRKFSVFFTMVRLAAVEHPNLLEAFGVLPTKVRRSNTTFLTSPGNLRVTHGKVSGEIVLRVEPVKGAKSYDISCCIGDPSVEGNWKHCGVGTKASRLLVSGLIPGTLYWFRVRAIGPKGEGPWSQFVSLMCI
ncbi:MAG: fibronectin type III domain-containing protein [Geobacter sp.]|nr:MAG: fibronectin type III domain-containing protein [Geobacter sp.]